jgi:hypothetical protein
VSQSIFIACVGIERTKGTGGGDFTFMMHGVAGECGVIGLQVEFEVLEQDRIRAGSSDKLLRRNHTDVWSVPLVWFDGKGSLKADLFLVINSHVQKFRKVVDLPFHISVPEAEHPSRPPQKT